MCINVYIQTYLKELAQIYIQEYFYGSDWKTVAKPSAATKKYCEHIKKVGQEQPFLLVAHQYTRYLGDLFGGQMMGGKEYMYVYIYSNKCLCVI
jgi:heme oxygenase